MYADDLFNKLILEACSASDMGWKVEQSNLALQEELDSFGYRQQPKKQVVLPSLAGVGSLGQRMLIRDKKVKFEGQVMEEDKYFGCVYNPKLSNTGELKNRARLTRHVFF